MIGYKAFNDDLTCRDFQYEIGETYEIDSEPICCVNGFHFCEDLKECFYYYDFGSRVCEIESLGVIDTEDNKKFCTNKIKIIRELSFKEVCKILGFSEKLGKLLIDSFNVSKKYKGFRCVWLGSGWNDGAYTGPFYWSLYDGSSSLSRYIGARLINDRIELVEDWGIKKFGYITEDGIDIIDDCKLKDFTRDEIINYCDYLKEKLFENNN